MPALVLNALYVPYIHTFPLPTFILWTHSNYHSFVVMYNIQKYKLQLLVTLSSVLSNPASAMAATTPLYILLTWQGNVSVKYFTLLLWSTLYIKFNHLSILLKALTSIMIPLKLFTANAIVIAMLILKLFIPFP